MAEKQKAPCLSKLALARLASGQREPLPEEAEHLAGCPLCRTQLQQETVLAHASAQEPVPAAIASFTQNTRVPLPGAIASRFSHWQHGTMAAIAVVAIVAVGMTARRLIRAPVVMDASAVLTQDSAQVSWAITNARSEVRIVVADSLHKLGLLRAGDMLQVHVQSIDKADVILTNVDDNTVYYTGDVPADGWLPAGIKVTTAGPPHVTLRVCPRTPNAPCQTWKLP